MATLRSRLGTIGVALAMTALIVPATAQAQDDSATTESAAEPVKLTWLIGEPEIIQLRAHGLADAYTALHPNVTFEFDTAPGGTEGDNLIKTRLATGEEFDLMWYNSGSLLGALNPTETLVDLTGQPFLDNIQESYLPVVSQDGMTFGVPSEDAGAGGIIYNKKIFEELGLSVPTTWAEFAANNEAIKAAGIAPLGASFADTWTSQILVLADYCNVAAAEPDFAERYTANEAKFADTPAALAGFQHLQDGYDNGWYQEDFGAAKYPDVLNLMIEGKVAQYPMLSFVIGQIGDIAPDAVDDFGFFGIPGDDPENACATLWMPSATYIPKTAKNMDAAMDFLAFIASVDGAKAEGDALPPAGPWVIKGAELPADVAPAVQDIAAYVDAGATAAALEFYSPVKGPSLEQITVAVGSGLYSAEEGAALYDQDVEKQARQLGLPGW